MPSSKKPRKAYRPYGAAFGVHRVVISEIKNEISRLNVRIGTVLRQGAATWDDMYILRDFINTTLIGAYVRGGWTAEYRDESIRIMHEGLDALIAVCTRGRETSSYVCRGEELERLQLARAWTWEHFEDGLDVCPKMLLAEWQLAVDIGREGDEMRVNRVLKTPASIKAAIEKKLREMSHGGSTYSMVLSRIKATGKALPTIKMETANG